MPSEYTWEDKGNKTRQFSTGGKEKNLIHLSIYVFLMVKICDHL